jgi:hypothetical protein
MKIANATKLNRKSGVAQWRDLRFSFGSHLDSEAPDAPACGVARLLKPYPSFTRLTLNSLPFRQQPINSTNLILLGQARLKAINKLDCQRGSYSANLDSSEELVVQRELHPARGGCCDWEVLWTVLWSDGVGAFTKAKPAQKLNAVLFSQSATPSTKRQRLVAAYG